jgi:hypothetical protein
MWLNTVSGEIDLKISRGEVEAFTSRLKGAIGEDGDLNVTVRDSWRKGHLSVSFTYSTNKDIHEFSTMRAIQEVADQNGRNHYVSVTFVDMRNFADAVPPRMTVYDLRMSEMPVIEMEDSSFTADIESMAPWIL